LDGDLALYHITYNMYVVVCTLKTMLNNYVTIIPESYVPMINMQLNVTMLQLQLDPESKKLLPLKLQRIYYNITGIPHSSCTVYPCP